MTVISALSPISLAQFFYASGKLVRPARLFFYKPETGDAVTVYADPNLGVPYEQPVLTGGSGRVPPIYVGTEPYRVRIFDGFGSHIEDISWLPGAVGLEAPEEPGGPTAGNALQTGDMFFAFAAGTTSRTGCVRANGGVIGPGTSPYGAGLDVERFNDDTHALFVHLWGQDGASTLAVVPSKGASAEDDWVAQKAMHLPDLRGRAIVGVDGMGAALTNRLAGVVQYGLANWSGGYGGTATAVLSQAQMPVHTHTVDAKPTGITIAANLTGIRVEAAIAALVLATTGISARNALTGVGTVAASTGAYISDPGHNHDYVTIIKDIGAAGFLDNDTYGGIQPKTFTSTTGIVFYDPTHSHPIYDPGHAHIIDDPGHHHNQAPHAHPVTDPTHAHDVVDPQHFHTLTPAGSGAALTTIAPFSLAVVYIKL